MIRSKSEPLPKFWHWTAAKIGLSFECEVRANCTVSKSVPTPTLLHSHLLNSAEIHRRINQSWLCVEEDAELDNTQTEKSYPEQLPATCIPNSTSNLLRSVQLRTEAAGKTGKKWVKILTQGYIFAINWIFVSSKFICWKLIPMLMVFGGGAFRRYSDAESRYLLNKLVPLWKGPQRPPLPHSTMWGHNKNTATMDSEAGAGQTWNLPASRSWISQPPEWWETNVVVYKPASVGDFL